MATTDKAKLRNAMGKHHKTVPELAEATGLSQGRVKALLHELVVANYTRQDLMEGGGYGYRRIGMPRRKPAKR